MKLLYLALAIVTATATANPQHHPRAPQITSLPQPCWNVDAFVGCHNANVGKNCKSGNSCENYCRVCCDQAGDGPCKQ